MQKIEHIGIAVNSLEEGEKLYESLLGIPPYKRETVESEKVVTSFFRQGPNKIELLAPIGDDGPISKFLIKKGPGIHHIAYAVTDIRAEMVHTDDFKVQITRIIQEIITNIVKHANATQMHLHLKKTNSYMALRISDNGKGYDTAKNSKGLGTKNIETRVQYLKGIYKVTSELEKGTFNMFLFKN